MYDALKCCSDPSNLGGAWTASDDFQGESWVGITSSNTGKNQTAIAAPGGLYMSNDYGESWKKSTSAPEFPQGNTYYQAVATNSDGQYIAAAVSGGPIFLSSDYGVSWVNCTGAPVSDATRWYSIDMSASGQYIGAVIMGGYVYMSTNYGKTWNRGEFSSTTNPQIHAWLEDDWFDIAISASGRYIVVVSGGDTGAIYYSSDYGNFFDPALLPISIKDLNQQWVGVAMDDAGQNVTVINSLIRGGLFSSNDYGATFTQVLTAPNVSMLGKVATSGDGRRMAMYSYIDMSTAKNIYLSGDGGVTWNATSAPTLSWSDLALTELGTFIYAPAFGDAIYTYLPNCPAGMIHSGYDSEGNKVCVACPAGSYTDAFPAETCTECSSGTYSTSEGNNGESSCQDCVYPWTTSGSGQTDCPVLWLNAPLMLTFLLIGALAALLVLMFLFGNDNQFVVLLIMGFPAVDALTDLVYLMISRFYSLPIFILCVLFFMHPTPMFFYKLYKYRALPYSFRFIWWLGYSSSFSSIAVDALNPAASPEDGNNNSNNNNNATASITHTGDHIPYPTILGRRFSLLVSFEQHDNLYVVVLELLTWVMAIVCQALTLVVLPAFLVLWLMVGIFLQMTKTIAMANVWNLWFYVWTGYNYWQDTPGAVDTEDLNYGLLAQFCLETIPHIVLQSINNTLLGNTV